MTKIYQINKDKNKELIVKLFSEVIRIFEKYNIDYWIEYGTLLGAVREGGFIPWDSEIDVGIWYSNYLNNEANLLKEFKAAGFFINLDSKDRVKLIHKDLLIGAYTIDIHTYHVKGNIAYVSHNPGAKLTIYKRIYKIIKDFDDRKPRVFPISLMLKPLMSNFNSIPSVFHIRVENNLLNEFSILYLDKIIYGDKKRKSILAKLTRYFLKLFLFVLPKTIRYKFIDYIRSRVIEQSKLNNKAQVFPVNYFMDLSKIKFETIEVSCPIDKVNYIESIYGKDWNNPKPHWVNTENKNNKNIMN